MIIQRTLTPYLKELATQFPIVALMGPRQSGKTTLTRETFPHYAYVTLEDLDRRSEAKTDPRGFFATYAAYPGVIIDEVQEVPELFSYLQGIVDQTYRPGYFIITGSQNFLLHEKITQTLAGRIALLTLLPLSIGELHHANLLSETLAPLLLKGQYPRLYAQNISTDVWCRNYISTYVEKDVRQVLRIVDVIAFQNFLKLCAARTGSILDYASLARDADISPNTAKSWISILESSYIIKLLQPYYKNFNKRVIKSPKLYFYDTALVCSLLGIRTIEEIHLHPLKGGLFESLIISELFKYRYNHSEAPNIYFWRDSQGHEIDVLLEKSFNQVIPIEIKAGMTIHDDFFKGLRDWSTISGQQDKNTPYVIYAGDTTIMRSQGPVYTWRDMDTLCKKIYSQG